MARVSRRREPYPVWLGRLSVRPRRGPTILCFEFKVILIPDLLLPQRACLLPP